MVTIVVSPRPQTTLATDYHACIEGSPQCWGCGKTANEAVGDLVRTHGDKFNLEIKDGAAYLKN
jgi:hypothetical protein